MAFARGFAPVSWARRTQRQPPRSVMARPEIATEYHGILPRSIVRSTPNLDRFRHGTRAIRHAGQSLHRGIAEFVSKLRYEDIPADVRTRIKLLMLDSLGCALYGADLEWSRILQRTLGELDTTPACARVGHEAAAVGAARGAGQRHAGAGLRARRRASPGRAARRRGGAARADRDHRDATRHERQGISRRPRSPATRSGRASASAWDPSTSRRAGIRARRSACSRPRRAPRAA